MSWCRGSCISSKSSEGFPDPGGTASPWLDAPFQLYERTDCEYSEFLNSTRVQKKTSTASNASRRGDEDAENSIVCVQSGRCVENVMGGRSSSREKVFDGTEKKVQQLLHLINKAEHALNPLSNASTLAYQDRGFELRIGNGQKAVRELI